MELIFDVNSPKDLKKLTPAQLKQYAAEAREFITNTVSETGGHLSSNLGTVEIICAMHYVFNSPRDKFIFDVGHQAYVHKLITGRRDEFSTLRSFGGISGFPKRSESIHDVFNTGHSSTSLSAALGIARTAALSDEYYHIVSLVGDGALTGGMLYEAMADAGASKNKLIMIVNDNEMSISKNVGAISAHLSNIRSGSVYNKFKNALRETLKNHPGIFSVLARTKNGIKNMLVHNNMFEALGFRYFGPFDGNNLGQMIKILNRVKNIDDNCVIHVNTVKGKGYPPAENNPSLYHGTSGFDVESGTQTSSKKSFSSVMGDCLTQLAHKNNKITAITAAMTTGTGLSRFAENFPDRFFDVGIAEGHAVTLAGGMAVSGYTPVFAVYSTFLQRAYDQILHDICLQNLHVVFCIDRAGIVGEDGDTHHGLYDIAFLSHMPNMTILAPSDFSELEKMLDYAINVHSGPIAIRYPKTAAPIIPEHSSPISYGRGEILVPGGDVLIFAAGDMVQSAVHTREILRQSRISAMVVDLRFIKPLDTKLILSNTVGKNLIVTMENGVISGGIGEKISALLFSNSVKTPVYSFAFPDQPIPHGKNDILFDEYGLTPDKMAGKILELLEQ